jgi:quercetin dioxygenase-like cupin family protein
LKIPRLYTGDDGQSHWDEIELAMESRPSGVLSVPVPQSATRISFARFPAGHVIDWHNSPSPQYVITLSGEAEYETEDGARRRFGPGSVFLVEERAAGQGHISRYLTDRVACHVSLAG